MLYNALGINNSEKELISIVGAGGKTTIMFHLAEEAKRRNKRVLITTTTAIYYPEDKCIDKILILDKLGQVQPTFDLNKKGCITVIGKSVSNEGKLLGVDKKLIDDIFNRRIFDLIVVEGDGAKRKPIKAPAYYEPVIPNFTTKVIGVIGLDAMNKKVDENIVHRAEIFCDITGATKNELISKENVINLILSSDGLFKGVSDRSSKYLIFNKADNDLRKSIGVCIAEEIQGAAHQKLEGIFITSFKEDYFEKVI